MKIIIPINSYPTRDVEFEKNRKKKKKKTIMASFQAKISLKSPRKNENKNYGFNQFLPDPF